MNPEFQTPHELARHGVTSQSAYHDVKDEPTLFETEKEWEKEWKGMPEFVQGTSLCVSLA